MVCKTKSTKCSTAKKKPAKTAKKTVASTEFKMFAPDAQEVYISGEFDNWETKNNRMRRFRDGFWRKKIKLQPGRYEYRFIVDGNWCCDPECGERCSNTHGSENSIVNVG